MHEPLGDPGAAGSKNDDEEEIKPVVPLSACLANLVSDETLVDYRSPATGLPGLASKHVRIQNFPRYLFVQLRRYNTIWFMLAVCFEYFRAANVQVCALACGPSRGCAVGSCCRA